MNFKMRYMVKNYSMRAVYWLFGVTSLLSAYTYIRWQKVIYYTDWLFKNADLNRPEDIKWIIDNYMHVNNISIYWCFVIAIGADLVLRKIFIRSV